MLTALRHVGGWQLLLAVWLASDMVVAGVVGQWFGAAGFGCALSCWLGWQISLYEERAYQRMVGGLLRELGRANGWSLEERPPC